MQQHWFYTVWPFIGVGGAIVMVAILLTTDTFRSNTTVSRWRDPVWLAWLAVPLYWVHQLEEYSLPVIGLALLTPRNGLRAIRLSAVSGLPYPHVVLPGGEHRTHVVRGATRSVHLQAQRPHRPQLLGIDHGERICAQRWRHRGGRL